MPDPTTPARTSPPRTLEERVAELERIAQLLQGDRTATSLLSHVERDLAETLLELVPSSLRAEIAEIRAGLSGVQERAEQLVERAQTINFQLAVHGGRLAEALYGARDTGGLNRDEVSSSLAEILMIASGDWDLSDAFLRITETLSAWNELDHHLVERTLRQGAAK